MAQHMLTTTDNPYDPFTRFNDWYQFDSDQGYHTPSLLARVTKSSDELSIADQDLALEYAMDEIVRENALGLHRKVTLETKSSDNQGD